MTVVGIEVGEAKTNNGDLDPGGSYDVDKASLNQSSIQFGRGVIRAR